jgi:hypothetical protein
MNEGVDANFIEWTATLGIGGILAGFMFVFYRKDIKMYAELWKLMAEQLTELVRDNTAASIRLITMLESVERNAMRKDDVEKLRNSHRLDDHKEKHDGV